MKPLDSDNMARQNLVNRVVEGYFFQNSEIKNPVLKVLIALSYFTVVIPLGFLAIGGLDRLISRFQTKRTRAADRVNLAAVSVINENTQKLEQNFLNGTAKFKEYVAKKAESKLEDNQKIDWLDKRFCTYFSDEAFVQLIQKQKEKFLPMIPPDKQIKSMYDLFQAVGEKFLEKYPTNCIEPDTRLQLMVITLLRLEVFPEVPDKVASNDDVFGMPDLIVSGIRYISSKANQDLPPT